MDLVLLLLVHLLFSLLQEQVNGKDRLKFRVHITSPLTLLAPSPPSLFHWWPGSQFRLPASLPLAFMVHLIPTFEEEREGGQRTTQRAF